MLVYNIKKAVSLYLMVVLKDYIPIDPTLKQNYDVVIVFI